jgi:hypothetical protein
MEVRFDRVRCPARWWGLTVTEVLPGNYTINGREITVLRMAVKDQFHVFRRVTPLLVPIYTALRAGKINRTSKSMMTVDVMMAMSSELAVLSDEQLDEVMDKCLLTVQIQGPDGNYYNLMVPTKGADGKVKGQLAYQDLDLPTLLQIVWAVLLENFRPFFSGMLESLSPDPVPDPVPTT